MNPLLLFLTLVVEDVVVVVEDVVEDVVEGVEVVSIVLIVKNMGTLKIGVSTYMVFPTKLLMLRKPLPTLSQRVNSKLLFSVDEHKEYSKLKATQHGSSSTIITQTVVDGSKVEATGVGLVSPTLSQLCYNLCF